MSEIQILEENEKSYTAIVDGKKVVLWKIDTEALDRKWNEKVKQAGKYRKLKELRSLINDLEIYHKQSPSVDDYEEIATNIANTLDNFIKDTPPAYNVYHTLFKYIHPECYGKAQIFSKYCNQLLEMLNDMYKYIYGDIK